MPSAFETLFAGIARPALLSHLGQASVVYTTPAGVATTLASAIVGPARQAVRESEQGQELVYERDVEISTAEVAAPAMHATVTIGAEVWTIDAVTAPASGLSIVTVVRPVRYEASSPGFRGR